MNELEPGRAAPFYSPPYTSAWSCPNFKRISVVAERDPKVLERLLANTPFRLAGSRFELFHDDLSEHSLGAFCESGVCVPIEYDGRAGIYHAVMWVSLDASLIGPREVFGYPKLLGEVSYSDDGKAARGSTVRNGRHVASVTFEGTETIAADDMQPLARDWRLGGWEWSHHFMVKSVPRADRPGADVFSVVYRNIEARAASVRRGRATLDIGDVPELEGLEGAEIVDAYVIGGDFGAGWGEERLVLKDLLG